MRAQWAKLRARVGAAGKMFEANAEEYFGHRKSWGTVAVRTVEGFFNRYPPKITGK